MIYEVAPGKLIETDRILDEDELHEARQTFEAGAELEHVATSFGGTVHTPIARERRADHVTIPREEYLRLLKAAGELE